MSSIYIQEPPTLGKVLIVTSVGDIDIELWSKEAPKACKNFIQLCMEGYYNGTIFHRVVKGFVVQGGDPTGTGTGGTSIYGEPFKDEFHTRLRFNRRGLVAMANAGKDDNGSQFFFTMAACPELQNKHTIFGKVTGETLYNMLKLEEGLIEHDERPAYPHKIIKSEVLNNPFPDIIPRKTVNETVKKSGKKKEKKTGVKNFKLLSFGDEAEEDEEETIEISRNYVGKSKSTHDLLDDPKLSSTPAVEGKKRDESESESSLSGDEDVTDSNFNTENMSAIRDKLKINKKTKENSEDEEYEFGKEEKERKKRKMEEIRKEIKDLKRSYQAEKKTKDKLNDESDTEEEKNKKHKSIEQNEMLKEYRGNLNKYKDLKSALPKKGNARQDFTMQLLAKFKNKLKTIKEVNVNEESKEVEKEEENDEVVGDDWMAHKLVFNSANPVVAKDANTKDDEWFDITDPRNAINKRRREQSKEIMKKREKRTF